MSNALVSLAESTNSLPAATPFPNSGSTLLALVRVLGALALVFAAFFGGLWAWRNGQRFLKPRGCNPKLAVLEAKSLGQRHTLFVVGYESQRMLVAASPNGVTMLSSLPAAEISNSTVPALEPARSASNFGALLLQALRQRS